MLMIGVIPLPALMKTILSGIGLGRVNSPSTSLRRTMSPVLIVPTRYGYTVPDGTSLGLTLTRPSTGSGSEVSEYARQW